jgi:hypothetical protein
MKNISNTDKTIELFRREFRKANGRNAQPAEVQAFKQALAGFEAVPIQEKISNLKRRVAAK